MLWIAVFLGEHSFCSDSRLRLVILSDVLFLPHPPIDQWAGSWLTQLRNTVVFSRYLNRDGSVKVAVRPAAHGGYRPSWQQSFSQRRRSVNFLCFEWFGLTQRSTLPDIPRASQRVSRQSKFIILQVFHHLRRQTHFHRWCDIDGAEWRR